MFIQMEHNSDSGKESDSWKVFRAFLAALPYSELSREDSWAYLSGNHEPDFISSDGKIAVELTGWIDERAIGKAKALENFNRKVRDVVHARRGEFKALEGHWVYLEARQVPPSMVGEDFVQRILAFLVGHVPVARILRLENCELPEHMRGWFRAVTIYKMQRANLLVRALWERAPFDPTELRDIEQVKEEAVEESLQSLKQNITKKIQKAGRYLVGGVRSFTELWLVIHYDDTALEWAAPWLGLVVDFRYGREAQESQRKLAERVRGEFLNALQGGQFDKVYLLFADTIPPFAEKLWPPPCEHNGC